MPTCTFPNCQSNSLRGSDYCIPHGKIYGVKVEKKPKAIAKKSKKQKKIDAKVSKIVKELKEKLGNECMVKSPVCERFYNVHSHHPQKRTPKNSADPKNIILCCNSCNQYIEKNSCWAKDKGLTVSRFKK